MPIHRLNEEPVRRAVLADITCDSDGKIDHFIDRRDVKDVLELHALSGTSPTTSACSWSAPTRRSWATCTTCSATRTRSTSPSTTRGGYRIDGVVAGDTVTDVLRYVRYSRDHLVAKVRQAAEAALRAKRMTIEESRHLLRRYEDGLSGYTYLEHD